MTDRPETYPLAPLAGFPTVLLWGLSRGLRSKKFFITLGLAALAGYGLTAAVHATSRNFVADFWEHALDEALLAVGLPLVALALVAGGFGEEVQDQTLVYHLVRPVARTTVFLARFAAGAVLGALAGAAMIAASFLSAGLSLPMGDVVATCLLAGFGVVAIGAVYYTLAATFRRGLVAGLVYTFVVEGIFQAIPGSTRKLSLMFHVRSLFHQFTDDAFSALSPGIGMKVRAMAHPFQEGPRIPGEAVIEPWTSTSTALLTCGAAVVIALLVGALAVRSRDFALKD